MKIIKNVMSFFGYAPVVIEPTVQALFKMHVGTPCEKCHRLFYNHLYGKFTMHMIDDHKVDREVATDLMPKMLKDYDQVRKERKLSVVA